jgi:hypothetical protein
VSVLYPPDDPLTALVIAQFGVVPEAGDRDLMTRNDDADGYDDVRALIVEARALAEAQLNRGRNLHRKVLTANCAEQTADFSINRPTATADEPSPAASHQKTLIYAAADSSSSPSGKMNR